VPAQPVVATPLLSFDLTILFKGPNPWGCSSLLPKQDAFSLHLTLRTILSPWNSRTWDFLLVLRRPIEITRLIRHNPPNDTRPDREFRWNAGARGGGTHLKQLAELGKKTAKTSDEVDKYVAQLDKTEQARWRSVRCTKKEAALSRIAAASRGVL